MDNATFIGIRNVAGHWWCTQQAVLKSRIEEIGFFATYLEDRILAARRLGLVIKMPREDDAILEIGREISLADVETLSWEDQNQAGHLSIKLC
jgi:hypothetical protein